MNAKAAAPVNKKEKIQELLKKGMGNSEIVAALKEDGISVSANYVSVTKKELGGGKKSKKTGRTSEPSFSEVMDILENAGGVGSIEKAIKAVEAAANAQELIDSLGGVESARKIAATLKK